MDKEKITQMAAQIIRAAESITAAGEFNRAQLSGIYRTAAEIMAECGKGEPASAWTACNAAECARTEG